MSFGLVLEGGGMRGIFTAGVIDYFLDNDIVADNVIGVSAGACHACSYVCGQRGRAYAVATEYLDDPEYCGFGSLRKTGDYFGADYLYRKIPEELYPLDHEAFKARGIKFQAAVTNMETGEPEYPIVGTDRAGMEIVRASSSMPFFAKMVELPGQRTAESRSLRPAELVQLLKGGKYMDGGISDCIPIRQSERQGNDKNVIVLTQPKGYRKKPDSKLIPLLKMKYRKYPRMIRAMKWREMKYNATLDYIEEKEARGEVFVIRPMGDLDIGRLEKNRDKFRKAYNEGYFVAEGLGEKLKAYLAE